MKSGSFLRQNPHILISERTGLVLPRLWSQVWLLSFLKDQPGDNFKISKVTSDLDSTLDALKKEIGRIIERKLDRNHLKKTLATHLHQLKGKHKKLTPTFISYLVKCFSYAVGQNKNDPSKMESAINNIVFHVSGKHDEWC